MFKQKKLILLSVAVLLVIVGFMRSGPKQFSFEFLNPELANIVQAKVSGGEYAVVVKSLVSERDVYSYNDTKPFPAGSLYKLFLMAEALDQIESGKIKSETKISTEVGHLKEVLGFGDFGYEGFSDGETITYTVDETLERIATISDNYAAVMLAEKVGWDNIQRQADQLGMKQTVIKDPITTSARDIALFFEKLYKKEVVSQAASGKITDLLSKSKINNRIPKLLPEGTKIAHKTGELPRIRHDSGIIFLDSTSEVSAYILVMMSKDLQFEDDGIETQAQLSKEVYDYFKSN